jgi:D-serine deaminase-like pyridoxal phosphate-dependent protein
MIDPADYQINDVSLLHSPGLVLFRELLEHNLGESIRLCGGPSRWRPHVKTHKTREIVRRQLELGVHKHKCATIAEAEMLAEEKVSEVLIAYPMVGPNVARLSKLIDRFPETRFATLIDHSDVADQIGRFLEANGQSVEALLDLNAGMDRTGIALNQQAIELYEMISSTPGLKAGGLHWYDGQHRQPDLRERKIAVLAGWEQFLHFRDKLLMSGLEVPRIVAAGTGSFAILAETEEPGLELSPGTTTLYDADCNEKFPELNFKPAVAILTRVISHSGSTRMTLDVGHKACAADQPAGKRLYFPTLQDAKEVQHTEEHLVIETSAAHRFRIGDHFFAISRHICPTMNIHSDVWVVSNNEVVEKWQVKARAR